MTREGRVGTALDRSWHGLAALGYPLSFWEQAQGVEASTAFAEFSRAADAWASQPSSPVLGDRLKAAQYALVAANREAFASWDAAGRPGREPKPTYRTILMRDGQELTQAETMSRLFGRNTHTHGQRGKHDDPR